MRVPTEQIPDDPPLHTHCRRCKESLPAVDGRILGFHYDGICPMGPKGDPCFPQLLRWIKGSPIRKEAYRAAISAADVDSAVATDASEASSEDPPDRGLYASPQWLILVDAWEMEGCP